MISPAKTAPSSLPGILRHTYSTPPLPSYHAGSTKNAQNPIKSTTRAVTASPTSTHEQRHHGNKTNGNLTSDSSTIDSTTTVQQHQYHPSCGRMVLLHGPKSMLSTEYVFIAEAATARGGQAEDSSPYEKKTPSPVCQSLPFISHRLRSHHPTGIPQEEVTPNFDADDAGNQPPLHNYPWLHGDGLLYRTFAKGRFKDFERFIETFYTMTQKKRRKNEPSQQRLV